MLNWVKKLEEALTNPNQQTAEHNVSLWDGFISRVKLSSIINCRSKDGKFPLFFSLYGIKMHITMHTFMETLSKTLTIDAQPHNLKTGISCLS